MLKEFVSINLLDSTNEIKRNYIDVRTLLDLYFKGGVISLSLNRQSMYHYLGKFYYQNKDLDKWINKSIFTASSDIRE